MRNSILLLATLLLLISCKKEHHHWLQEYQSTKCNWEKTEEQFKHDSIFATKEFVSNLTELNEKIKLIQEPYQKKIDALQEQIEAVSEKHLEISRKITAVQTEKYGHRSTPEYERNLKVNQQNEDNEVSALNFSLDNIKNEMANNASLNSLTTDRDKSLKKIHELISAAKAKYKVVFDSLQNVLNIQNTEFKEILSELSEPEKHKLSNQRDSIRLKPCNELKN